MSGETKLTVGIDIGCESTKVVLGPSCEIVRNEVGGHTTPTLVAFSGRNRYMGDGAFHYKGSPNTVTNLSRLAPKDDDPLKTFYRFSLNSGAVQADYDGSTKEFDPSALLAMLLGKICHNVQSTLDRISSDDKKRDAHLLDYVFAMAADEAARNAVRDAAFAAGLEHVCIVDTADCTAAAYHRKFSQGSTDATKTIMVVDMGHAETTVSLLMQENEQVKVLSSAVDSNLGAGVVDVRLWQHFQSTVPALKDVTPSSKAGYRLMESCRKLKHLLSQLPEGSVTVENINDADHVLSGTRTLLMDLCQAQEQSLVQLLQEAMEKAQVESSALDSVEALGGACRIPWVKDTILKTAGISSLSYSLDDTSVALGAAVLTDRKVEELHPNERRTQLRDSEQAMLALDVEMRKRAHVHNQVEAHVLEMRAAKHGKHGSLLPETLDDHLNKAEELLHDNDDVTLEEMETKLADVLNTTNDICSDYFKAVQEETEAKEREMEIEAKRAQAERNDNSDEDEDHDNRRLPKKRRMEIVQKNKREANELFGDGNYRHAAARYNKALTHCSKFVDLSPEDVKEVNDVKLSLNLNLALAYLKLEMVDQALRVCNDAVAIDNQSAKALYRRATVFYEKKQWDKANRDAQEAAKLAPDDKAIQKLQARIEQQIKRQKAKEKKMAQKMFG